MHNVTRAVALSFCSCKNLSDEAVFLSSQMADREVADTPSAKPKTRRAAWLARQIPPPASSNIVGQAAFSKTKSASRLILPHPNDTPSARFLQIKLGNCN